MNYRPPMPGKSYTDVLWRWDDSWVVIGDKGAVQFLFYPAPRSYRGGIEDPVDPVSELELEREYELV